MALTKDQKEAAKRIADWWKNGGEHFVLSGEPGVGKTYLARYAVDQLTGAVPIFTAPTNEAVYQLEQALGNYDGKVITTYKALGLGMSTNSEVQKITQIRDNELDNFNLLIVDESSMVGMAERSSDAAELIDYIWDSGIRVIWLGDPQQLPPINRNNSPVFEEKFSEATDAEKYHLTEVVRHSGELLDFVRALRNWTKTSPFPPSGEAVKFVKSHQLHATLFEERYFNAFISGEAKYIAWTNKRVDEINQLLREHRYGKEVATVNKFCPGDYILFTQPLMIDTAVPFEEQDIYKFFKSKRYRTVVTTNAKAEVVKVEMSEIWGIQCYKLSLRVEGKTEVIVLSPTKKGEVQYNRIKNAIAKDAKEARAKGDRAKAARLWLQFHSIKTALANLKLSYAITGHRAQGSSVPIVFADANNLLSNRSTIVGQKNFYVACSRAQKGLIIITNRSK